MKKDYRYCLVVFFITLLSVSFPVSPASAAYPPPLLIQWGSLGNNDGQFNYPYGVAVDSSGNVFVADGENRRIQKFTSDGIFVTKWGTSGSGDGQFGLPSGIAVASGYVYVVDSVNHRIQKFTSDGIFVTKWGSIGGMPGAGDGQFRSPYGIALDSSGYVYVVDSGNHRIQKFTTAGVFVTKWDVLVVTQYDFPTGIAVASGYVYISDTDNQRIQKFTSDGIYVTNWGASGSGDGQFAGPRDISVDSSGYVYVVDSANHRIQKFTTAGVFVTKWGAYGSGDGRFDYPYGIAVDSSGNVYVSDQGNDRIQKFAPQEHIPPTVTSTNPVNGTTGISTSTPITVTFSEPMSAVSIVDQFILTGGGSSVACTQNISSTQATITPISKLANNTTYTATVTTGVKDITGNPMASNFTWTFTTEQAAPAPTSGGSGGGGGCAMMSTRESDDQSPIGLILTLLSPVFVLVMRKAIRRSRVRI